MQETLSRQSICAQSRSLGMEQELSIGQMKNVGEMDRKTRKMLTICKSFHPREDVGRPYWEKAEGGRGLKSVEKVVTIEECSLGRYLVQTDEILLKKII